MIDAGTQFGRLLVSGTSVVKDGRDVEIQFVQPGISPFVVRLPLTPSCSVPEQRLPSSSLMTTCATTDETSLSGVWGS